MIHDISPMALAFFDDFGIHWYGLSYLVALLATYSVISWMAERQQMGLSREMVLDSMIYSILGALIGGRLGYCLFYAPELFISFKPSPPFWGVLALNEGGMSSHGGIIGLIIFLLLFSLKTGRNKLYLLDLAALAGSLGIFFGRIADFVNGEILGRPAPPSLPWAVRFPQEILFWPKYDPQKLVGLTKVIESVPGLSLSQWESLCAKILENPSNNENLRSMEDMLLKILTSLQNGNEKVKASLPNLLEFRHPVQLYGALLEGLFIFIFLFILWHKPRRSGLMALCFLILYSLARLFDEEFREPDFQLGFRWFDLTQGQWLSMGMFCMGIGWLFVFLWRRDILPTPGWGMGPHIKVHRRH